MPTPRRTPSPGSAAPAGPASAASLQLAAAPGRLWLPGGGAHGRHVDRPADVHLTLHLRDAALLAWLALEGPTLRSRVAALLWPDRTPAAARNSLRQRLFQLRRQAGIDVVQGEDVLALAAGLRHDLDDADTLLGDVDPGIEGEYAAWLAQQRTRRLQRRQARLAELAAQAEQAAAWPEALAHAHALLALEPWSEDAHRRVMRLHYLAGDRAAALLAFDRCERVLKDEVGTRPSAATMALLATLERAGEADPWPVVDPVAALQRPPRLVGRAAERAALAAAVAEGGVVLLTGEAGIGKSRVLAELTGAMPAGRLVQAGARPGEAAQAYALAARLLRALLSAAGHAADAHRVALAPALPEYGGPPESAAAAEAASALLGVAAEALVADAVRGGVRAIAIDDLHYADDASVALLRGLVGGGGCAWLIALRPDELSPAARALVAAQSGATGCRSLALAPLGSEAIGELLVSLGIRGLEGAAEADSLRRHTGGNPLYVLETLKVAMAERRVSQQAEPGSATQPVRAELVEALAPTSIGPTTGSGRTVGGGSSTPPAIWTGPRADGVLPLIRRRLARLGPLATKLARCAAIAGPDFDVALASDILSLSPLDLAEAWSELEAADVLHDQAFAHDLIAEAARASVPAPIARALHGEIARFLEARGGAPLRIAEHLLASGADAAGARWLAEAGHAAFAAWRCDDAAGLYLRAGQLLRDCGERAAAFEVLLCGYAALAERGRDDRLGPLAQQLRDLAEDDGQHGGALLAALALAIESGRLDEARRLADRALPLVRRAGRADLEVELLWNSAALHWEARQLDGVLQAADQALARLPEADLQRAPWLRGTRLKLHHAQGVALAASGRPAPAREAFEATLALARQARDPSQEALVLNALTVLALEQGELGPALVHGDALEALAAAHALPLPAERQESRVTTLALAGELARAWTAAQQMAERAGQQRRRAEVQLLARMHWLQAELGWREHALQGLRALAQRDDVPPAGRALVQALRLHVGDRFDPGPVLEGAAGIDDLGLRVLVLCLAQPGCEPAQILPLLQMNAASAEQRGAEGLWSMAQCRRVAALRDAERHDEAAALAARVWPRLAAGVTCSFELLPRSAHALHGALAGTQHEMAGEVAARASRWIRDASQTLPLAWRRRFVERSAWPAALPGR